MSSKPIVLAEYRLENGKYVKRSGGPEYADEMPVGMIFTTPVEERTAPAAPPTPPPPSAPTRRRWEQYSSLELETMARERPALFRALLRERQVRRELGMLDLSRNEIIQRLESRKRSNALSAYRAAVDTVEYELFGGSPLDAA